MYLDLHIAQPTGEPSHFLFTKDARTSFQWKFKLQCDFHHKTLQSE